MNGINNSMSFLEEIRKIEENYLTTGMGGNQSPQQSQNSNMSMKKKPQASNKIGTNNQVDFNSLLLNASQDDSDEELFNYLSQIEGIDLNRIVANLQRKRQ